MSRLEQQLEKGAVVHAVEAADAVSAWHAAATRLLTNGEETHLIVQINGPATFDRTWLSRFSPHLCSPTGDKLANVVNTVFPWKLALSCANRDELYQRYMACHKRSQRMGRHRGAWGTYFARLVQFGPDGPNQLETVIRKLRQWRSNFKAAFVFHPSGPHLDSPRPRGGPCWQYGQLLGQSDGTLDLLVVYRNHDYFNKALGNFLALGQLHRFICVEGQKLQGKLVCHSAHAYFHSTKAQLEALLAK
jgi:hypothetical protein